MVEGAEDFIYQIWPVDKTTSWIERFGTLVKGARCWRKVKGMSSVKAEVRDTLKCAIEVGEESKIDKSTRRSVEGEERVEETSLESEERVEKTRHEEKRALREDRLQLSRSAQKSRLSLGLWFPFNFILNFNSRAIAIYNYSCIH
jgi:hypothetical protein